MCVCVCDCCVFVVCCCVCLHNCIHHPQLQLLVKVVELDLLLLSLLVLCRAYLYPPCSLALLFVPHYSTVTKP